MALNWAALRVWGGSREAAFEELCCQVAAQERPAGGRFTRKGTPDAGVECYWTLTGGDEHCWQAKFFEHPPTAGQWGQADDSVRAALDAHPRLTRYVVCMAADRSDARLAGRRSFLDRWGERVAKWQGWASAGGRSVGFEYWGNHELAARLSREENRGRQWFWFDAEQFTPAWFETRLDVAVANAGERYTPELHVELPLARAFDALGRTPALHARLGERYKGIRTAFAWLPRTGEPVEAQAALTDIRLAADRLFETLDDVLVPLADACRFAPVRPVPWGELDRRAAELVGLTSALHESLSRSVRERQVLVAAPIAPTDAGQSDTRALSDLASRTLDTCLEADRLRDFCRDSDSVLANRPALLLVGGAGQGKTHLLCDVARRDTAAGRPRVLLHGSHFTDAEPWSQVVTTLGLRCGTDEFLGALEAAAQASGSRAVVLIDALNEGDGRRLWAKHLPGMLVRLAHTPWVGLAVSVRDSYEELVVPAGLVPARLTRVAHAGFREHEYEAVNRFFAHFNIQPTAPPLVPEFSNPLFLKLFCQSVRGLGLNRVPVGLRGITATLNAFLDATNRHLADPARLNYDERSHPVRRAVDAVVRIVAETGSYHLPRERAVAAVNGVHPAAGYDRSLFRHLVAEGVLSESRLQAAGGPVEVVHFAYERFADHLLARHLLDEHLDPASPETAFAPQARIGRFLASESAAWDHAGLIEALSVQLPERVGRELIDLAPGVGQFWLGGWAFVRSLVWRDAGAFTPATFRHLEAFRGDGLTDRDVFDAMLTVAPVPGHPLNADALHRELAALRMPDRDARWSVFLHYECGAGRAVDRLVDWAWGDSDKSALTDEVALLTGTALAWLLTSSHRRLRDRATKALVRLFDSRVRLLPQLLGRFQNVDDPYVRERLVAAAYGCAMRARGTDGLAELAGAVVELVFSGHCAALHVLTRDYGRCVVELACHRGAIPSHAFPESGPPYTSTWPDMQIPSKDELEVWGKSQVGQTDEEWAHGQIYQAVTDKHFHDFGKYLGDFTEWTSVRLGESPPQTSKGRYEAFLRGLSKSRRKSFDRYDRVRGNVRFCRGLSSAEKVEFCGEDVADDDLEALERSERERFERVLARAPDAREEFRTFVMSYLDSPEQHRLSFPFDGDAARRWIVQRVLDYGWTRERFGAFDAPLRRLYGRPPDGHWGEPIGEKYQWIALRELLARLGDNFHVRSDRYGGDGLKVYAGLQDIPYGHGRDIDPSVTIRGTRHEQTATRATWWSPVVYDAWGRGQDSPEWLRSNAGLPSVPGMVAVRHPRDGSLWYVLDTYVNWEQPARPGRKDYQQPRRMLYYFVNGYVVRDRDADVFFRWAKEQHFMGRWMPEPPDVHGVGLGEFHWAPGYRAWASEWGTGWKARNNMPCEVLVTALEYFHESSTRDGSVDDSLRVCVPTVELAEGVGLRWAGIEGRYVDAQGDLAAVDPSVSEPGPSSLAVRADLLTRYLADNGLTLFWTVLGEKQVIGEGRSEGLGWLEVSGVYRLTSGEIIGCVRAEHSSAVKTTPPSQAAEVI